MGGNGREWLLALLSEQLAEARAGGGQAGATVVLLTGPPGIGKTRLLDEFPPRELAEGVTVLRGGASRAAGMPPYLPFLEALGDYLAAAPVDQFRAEVGHRAANLASLAPPPPEMQQLFAALRDNQEQTNRFFGLIAGTTPIPEFFSPENMAAIVGDVGHSAAA